MYTARAYRSAASDLLAFTTEPLAFGDKWNPVAFLMDSQVTAIAKDDGIGIFTIPIVADDALGVGLIARSGGLAINGRGRA